MGYNIYLVKGEDWADDDNLFSESEWQGLHPADAAEGMYFDGEHVTVKNPSADQIRSLVAIASERGWRVQGDDGEFYNEQGKPIEEVGTTVAPPLQKTKMPRPSILLRFVDWLRARLQPGPRTSLKGGHVCTLRVGDRVRDSFRSGGRVIKVDPRGLYGYGYLEVRYPDGAVIGYGFTGHDITLES